MCKDSISKNVKYIKALGNGKYEAHEMKRNCILVYIITISNDKIKILEEKEVKKV